METTTGHPTIEGVKTRRAGLHHILVDLETAISAAAAGREDPWADQVRVALARLSDAFTEHVEQTEGPDGLFDQVRRRAPRLDAHCRRLTDEHRQIATRLAGAAAALDDDTASAREAVLKLLALMSRHRQRGADLVYEAYEVDLGGSD
ncbi:MAG TPA: hemerythrin domain-containing protein [Egibacteraceae bacterium]|nr:hemerythrin domain-containing protein [Egibacteraceae bacterium]